MDNPTYRRVNVMILEHQYQAITDRELNLSGLIRDQLGDYLSKDTITIQVSEDTRRLYDTLVANAGSSDEEIEVHLRDALAKLLEKRIALMQQLHKRTVADTQRIKKSRKTL